jgi:molybdopterin converting factor subunit 1
MKKIHILFFGRLKETWQTSHIEWQTHANDVEEVYAEILEKASEVPHKASIKAAINDEFVDWNHRITEGDNIAFLPPASGG